MGITPEELDALAHDAIWKSPTTQLNHLERRVHSAISQALSLQRESVIEEWIPSKERLPDTPGTGAVRVLAWVVHDGMGWMAVRFYNNRKWWSNGEEIFGEDITHWMPLPKPPSEL